MSEPSGRLVLILASANKDKAREMKEILSSELAFLVELRDRPLKLPEVEETGETLEENARLKAAAIKDATGFGAIADDTGLEVLALGGRPGVHTARFAGPAGRADDNIALLLAQLADSTDRRARFHTIALAAMPDGTELVAAGMLEGTIARRPRGSGGFGYDPVFVPDDAGGRTLAEMDSQQKHAISHRGRALRALARQLRTFISSDLRPTLDSP